MVRFSSSKEEKFVHFFFKITMQVSTLKSRGWHGDLFPSKLQPHPSENSFKSMQTRQARVSEQKESSFKLTRSLSVLCLAAQACPPPCGPMDRSPPGSSVHGIFQARVLEWGAITFSITIFLHFTNIYVLKCIDYICMVQIFMRFLIPFHLWLNNHLMSTQLGSMVLKQQK